MVKKVSNTGVGIVSPIAAYLDAKEAQDLAPQYVRYIKAGVVGAPKGVSSLGSDEFVPTDALVTDEDSELVPSEEVIGNEGIKTAPNLSDIELISNDIVYDLGNPTATVVFKVRNSTGVAVKSVNARVEII